VWPTLSNAAKRKFLTSCRGAQVRVRPLPKGEVGIMGMQHEFWLEGDLDEITTSLQSLEEL